MRVGFLSFIIHHSSFIITNVATLTKAEAKKIIDKVLAYSKADETSVGLSLIHIFLAAQKGVGEVAWKTPLTKNAFEIPVKEKIDLLMKVNGEAMKNGAGFVTSNLFLVNEQKYFASTDGSYIEQDIHRIWPTFTVTAVDKAAGKFKTRDAISSPMGMGYELSLIHI